MFSSDRSFITLQAYSRFFWFTITTVFVCRSQEDPMYFCALLLQCFRKEKCDVFIANLNVTPSVVVQGL